MEESPPNAFLPQKTLSSTDFVKIVKCENIHDFADAFPDEEILKWVSFQQKSNNIAFYNVFLNGDITLKNIENPSLSLSFNKCSIEGRLNIIDTRIQRISIFGGSNFENVETTNTAIEVLETRDSLLESLEIKNHSKIVNVEIINSTIGSLKLENSAGDVLRIASHSKIADIFTWQLIMNKIEVKGNCFISSFKCHLDLHHPSEISLEGCRLSIFDLSHVSMPEFSILRVVRCKVNQLAIKNFCNYGTIFFVDLNKLPTWEDFKRDEETLKPIHKKGGFHFTTLSRTSTLHFTDSDLGKTQFISCDLRLFDLFEFCNTKMLDVFVAGSRMPKSSTFRLPEGAENDIFEQKRLAYSQFKRIYEAQGDVAGSLRYLAYEMNAYQEQLLGRIERQRLFSRDWFDYLGELSILFLNRFSTNYGNNWLRGAFATVAVTVGCFALYCFLLGYRPQLVSGDWHKFADLASHALVYLNPFRDEDSGAFFEMIQSDGLKIHWYARLWDYFSRIIIAYFVYQTIQAFRKLGKSSG